MNVRELRIRTPEGITFAYRLAGPVTRCLAWAVDLAAVLALLICVNSLVNVFAMVDADFAQGVSVIAYFVLTLGYGVVFEWWWRGQTVGKRMLRLRVIDADGLRLQFHQVLMRNLVRFADLLPGFYAVGGISCLLNRKAQRLGDLAAGTVVVHHARRTEPDLEQLLGNRFNSLRAHPHLAARLRQSASPLEAALVLQALLRRDEFDAASRVRLFRELAEHFQAIVAFPPEDLEAMPDEQFIRNVVDILFRTDRANVATVAA